MKWHRCGTLAAIGGFPTISTRALIIVAILTMLQTCATTAAQAETSFTNAERFNIPSLSGEVGFASNGTYKAAVLENGTWCFIGLKLDRSQQIGNLSISARNSTIIITSYRAGTAISNTTVRYAWLRYIATGQGQQTVNLGIPAGEGRLGLHPEWSVIVNNNWLGEGQGWSIAPDGTVTVNNAIGNVSVARWSFSISGVDTSNLSFYERHYVAIGTVSTALIVVAVAVLIKIRSKKSLSEMPQASLCTSGKEEPT